MKCSRGHANRAGRRFCAECGAPLTVACAACGFANEVNEKFCGGCGQPTVVENVLSSRAALEGERKQVTILFADLKGSMELLADRDPEEARKILDPILGLMMDAVHRYEGTVNQVMGDGIMALFGAPIAHEDHAVRACYAAIDIQTAARRYAERPLPGVVSPLVRVGLNTGELVALVGEPGVGKSRVVWEFLHDHVPSEWRILQARSISFGKATPYLPVVGLLQRIFGIDDHATAARITEAISYGIAALDASLTVDVPALLAVNRELERVARDLDLRPLEAHAHLGLGRLSHRGGRPGEAADHLATALATYRDMGMTHWMERAEALFR